MKKSVQFAVFCTMFVLGVTGYYVLAQDTAPAISMKDNGADTENKTVQITGIIAEKSKTELIGESQVILSGKVKEILPSKWSNPNFERGQNISNVIQTDIIIQVGKVFKGQPHSTKDVAVRINKGQVGNTVWKSEGFPDFSQNEDVVLFLREDDSDNERPDQQYYVLTGMKQGKFIKSNQTNDSFSNGKDIMSVATLASEIPNELEKFKKLPKMADPKVYKP